MSYLFDETSYFNTCCTDTFGFIPFAASETKVKHSAIIFITKCSQYLLYTNTFEIFLCKQVHAFEKTAQVMLSVNLLVQFTWLNTKDTL